MIKREGLHPCWECDGEGKTPSSSYIDWKDYKGEYEKYKKELENSVKMCSMCSGEGELFYQDEEEYFNKLVDRWNRDTINQSFALTTHPAYKTIKKMGIEKVATFVLKRVRKDELTLIIMILSDMVKMENWPKGLKENRGKLEKMTEIWTEWGKEKGYIK